VVVAQLPRLSGEAKIGNLGDGWWLVGLEAKRPLALRLVLQLELEILVLEIGQAELGRDTRVPDTASRATCKFGVLSVRVLVVRGLAVADHGHDVGEHHAGPIVLISIEEDAEALEFVGATENGALLSALFGDPHGEAVAVESVFAMDLEFHLDFPVRSCQWHSRKQPSVL